MQVSGSVGVKSAAALILTPTMRRRHFSTTHLLSHLVISSTASWRRSTLNVGGKADHRRRGPRGGLKRGPIAAALIKATEVMILWV